MICRPQGVWQPQDGKGEAGGPGPSGPYTHRDKAWYTEAADPREWEREARAFLQAGLLSQHGFQ